LEDALNIRCPSLIEPEVRGIGVTLKELGVSFVLLYSKEKSYVTPFPNQE